MENSFGPITNQILQYCNAWIVGSTADPAADLESGTEDVDIMVPFCYWHLASTRIPKEATVNSFGGWKFEEAGWIVDIWPDSLDTIMNNNNNGSEFLYHPRSDTRWQRIVE